MERNTMQKRQEETEKGRETEKRQKSSFGGKLEKQNTHNINTHFENSKTIPVNKR